ncbi:hypothetical protein FUT69_09535 [Xylella taiwanensis]|uniref:Uncharacterized protein n=1 Tax=Xylella taiwanensis TaxID=1444770 RepID=A0ABS8TTE7_9GAMM|nr:hypothetical protein [Xylella taiwanensis]MCD8456057.1 hypothetical protein [Xylella taiwanensis]MCD8458461.1 hypothetical protein [Xylella taiwanensis]MCD8460597.1 hypothetical protein [Xylella taiwanensis]MCD8463341.1 hypothetical protein [Xylella taiwanensis]MCD8465102.1 hypothetical protein [Xylella taiwanensis]
MTVQQVVQPVGGKDEINIERRNGYFVSSLNWKVRNSCYPHHLNGLSTVNPFELLINMRNSEENINEINENMICIFY